MVVVSSDRKGIIGVFTQQDDALIATEIWAEDTFQEVTRPWSEISKDLDEVGITFAYTGAGDRLMFREVAIDTILATSKVAAN